jgi:hypothetical protein
MPPVRDLAGDLRRVAIRDTSRKRRETFGVTCNHRDKIRLAQQCWQMCIENLVTIRGVEKPQAGVGALGLSLQRIQERDSFDEYSSICHFPFVEILVWKACQFLGS